MAGIIMAFRSGSFFNWLNQKITRQAGRVQWMFRQTPPLRRSLDIR
jgi:aminoglycoside N3'-acetyltransferase